MSWPESLTTIDDVLTGRLVVESKFASDNGKAIKVSGTSTGFVATQTLVNRRTIFRLPAQERYQVEMISTEKGVEFVDFTDETIIIEAGGYQRIVIELESSYNQENENGAVASWEKVRAIINAHAEAKYFQIGDEIDLYLNDENKTHHPMVVGAINHDEMYPHQVIFVSKYCLPTALRYHSAENTSGGWAALEINHKLNGEAFFDLLPDKLQEIIDEREWQANSGGNTSTLSTFSSKIWIPREREVVIARVDSRACEDTVTTQFAYFVDPANRVKYAGEGGDSCWWGLQSFSSTNPHICRINLSGNSETRDSMLSARCQLPCFHIVADDTKFKLKALSKYDEENEEG